MPALPSVPGVVRCTLDYTVGPDTAALSRFFVHYGGTAPTNVNLQTFAGSIGSAFNTDLCPSMSTSSALLRVKCEDLSSASGAIGEDDTERFGTVAGAPIPASSSFVVGFSIARRYRGGKPKIFLPLGVAANLAGNLKWTPAFVLSAGTSFQSFINLVLATPWTAGGPLTHVNVSYFSGFTVVTNPVTHRARNVPTLRGAPVVDAVTLYTTELNVGSQRRRNRQ